MWRPKNYREALLPLQLICWLFCVGIIQYPLNQPQIGVTVVYTISAIVTYCIVLSYTLAFTLNESWFNNSEAILLFIIYVNIFIYLINIVLLWIWRKQANKMVERLLRVDEILERLDVPLDYQSIYVLSLKTIVSWIFIFLTSNTIHMMWLHEKVDLLTNFIVVFVLLHTIHANTIIIISISSSIQTMKCRFAKVNEMLLKIGERKKTGVDRRWPPAPLTIIAGNFRYDSSPSRSTNNNIMRIAKHLHLELSLLSNECSRVFGIQIAMELTASFIVVTGITFAFYIVMVSSLIDESSKLLRMIVLTYWLSACYIRIVNVNRVCANTTAEWKKTGKIIHELAILHDDNKFRDEIRQFSLQIMQNPVSFTAYGLITLGHSFLRGFIGSVTTYVVILVQMYNTP